MDKKLLFHIIICALLFVTITLSYIIFSEDNALLCSAAQESPQSNAGVTEDGGVITIGEEVRLSCVPASVYPGENAVIKIVGKPNTLYDINVYYPSGISSAKAFDDKYSDENGIVAWEFKVSAKTTAKNLRVVIRSESSYISFNIPVTDL